MYKNTIKEIIDYIDNNPRNHIIASFCGEYNDYTAQKNTAITHFLKYLKSTKDSTDDIIKGYESYIVNNLKLSKASRKKYSGTIKMFLNKYFNWGNGKYSIYNLSHDSKQLIYVSNLVNSGLNLPKLKVELDPNYNRFKTRLLNNKFKRFRNRSIISFAKRKGMTDFLDLI